MAIVNLQLKGSGKNNRNTIINCVSQHSAYFQNFSSILAFSVAFACVSIWAYFELVLRLFYGVLLFITYTNKKESIPRPLLVL